MDEELVRRIDGLEKRLDGLVLPEKSLRLAAPFLDLPVLRGLWVASVDSAGDWYDLSGLGKTLSYNGNPTVNHNGLVPYWDYDGAGDFHSRADEADLDIVGTEAYIAADVRGLTFGGWFYPTVAALSQMIGKANDANGPYWIYNSGAGVAVFRVRNAADGANFQVQTALALNAWQFIVGRYRPTPPAPAVAELKIWNNATTNTNVVGIPASILNGADAFAIGAQGAGANPFTGRCACAFLCAAAASDAMLSSAFQATKGLFGV
jgi:hypothetical protein